MDKKALPSARDKRQLRLSLTVTRARRALLQQHHDELLTALRSLGADLPALQQSLAAPTASTSGTQASGDDADAGVARHELGVLLPVLARLARDVEHVTARSTAAMRDELPPIDAKALVAIRQRLKAARKQHEQYSELGSKLKRQELAWVIAIQETIKRYSPQPPPTLATDAEGANDLFQRQDTALLIQLESLVLPSRGRARLSLSQLSLTSERLSSWPLLVHATDYLAWLLSFEHGDMGEAKNEAARTIRSLRQLDLSRNELDGVLPSRVVELWPGLKVLSLSHNTKLESLPPVIVHLTQLRSLRTAGTKLHRQLRLRRSSSFSSEEEDDFYSSSSDSLLSSSSTSGSSIMLNKTEYNGSSKRHLASVNSRKVYAHAIGIISAAPAHPSSLYNDTQLSRAGKCVPSLLDTCTQLSRSLTLHEDENEHPADVSSASDDAYGLEPAWTDDHGEGSDMDEVRTIASLTSLPSHATQLTGDEDEEANQAEPIREVLVPPHATSARQKPLVTPSILLSAVPPHLLERVRNSYTCHSCGTFVPGDSSALAPLFEACVHVDPGFALPRQFALAGAAAAQRRRHQDVDARDGGDDEPLAESESEQERDDGEDKVAFALERRLLRALLSRAQSPATHERQLCYPGASNGSEAAVQSDMDLSEDYDDTSSSDLGSQHGTRRRHRQQRPRAHSREEQREANGLNDEPAADQARAEGAQGGFFLHPLLSGAPPPPLAQKQAGEPSAALYTLGPSRLCATCAVAHLARPGGGKRCRCIICRSERAVRGLESPATSSSGQAEADGRYEEGEEDLTRRDLAWSEATPVMRWLRVCEGLL